MFIFMGSIKIFENAEKWQNGGHFLLKKKKRRAVNELRGKKRRKKGEKLFYPNLTTHLLAQYLFPLTWQELLTCFLDGYLG